MAQSLFLCNLLRNVFKLLKLGCSDHPHLRRMDVGVGVGGTEIPPPASHYEAISLWHNQAYLPLTGQNCMFAMYILLHTLFLSFTLIITLLVPQ